MTTLLTYTSLDKTYSNHEVQGQLALYSVYLVIQTLPLILKDDGLIIYQQGDQKGSTKIEVPEGRYSIEQFETLVKKHVSDFSMRMNKEGKIVFQVSITTRMVWTPNMLDMVGLNNEVYRGQWFTQGEHFSANTFYTSKDSTVQLHCKQLSKSKHLINGLYTNCLAIFPLTPVIQYTPQNLIFLPVENSTRYLDFKVLYGNGAEVEVTNIYLQLVNRQ